MRSDRTDGGENRFNVSRESIRCPHRRINQMEVVRHEGG